MIIKQLTMSQTENLEGLITRYKAAPDAESLACDLLPVLVDVLFCGSLSPLGLLRPVAVYFSDARFGGQGADIRLGTFFIAHGAILFIRIFFIHRFDVLMSLEMRFPKLGRLSIIFNRSDGCALGFINSFRTNRSI